MSKTPLYWEKTLNIISSLQYLERVYNQQVKTITNWSIGLLGLIFIGSWNWQLLLATVAGSGLMVLVYWLQNNNWSIYWSKWQHWLAQIDRQLIISVGSGSITALSIYLAACIWSESENQWLATGIILQTFASLLTLGVIVWYFWYNHRLLHQENQYNRLLNNLSDRDSLKKIIAIHQLTRLIKKGNLPQDYQSQVVSYYCLMLSQFQEVAVQEVLLDSLNSLGVEEIIKRKQQPVQIPTEFKSSPKPIYHSPK